MEAEEFDKFAEKYLEVYVRNIRLSGETLDSFAEYMVMDMANALL